MIDIDLRVKPIKGYEDLYLIFEDGKIWSLPRKRKQGGVTKGRFLKQHLTQNGYAFVTLFKDGKKSSKRIHCLVAENFISKRPKGLVIHHIDNNKLNNKASNLEYVSKQKNTQEYYKTIGKSNGYIRLEEIPNIIDRVNKGEKCKDIADEFNVTRNDIAVLCKIILH